MSPQPPSAPRQHPASPRGARGALGWGGAALGVLCALAGCVGFLPLPLSPVQVLSGAWPPKVNAPGAPRPYQIVNLEFSIPSLSFSIRRPDFDWTFVPLPTGVKLVQRNLAGTEPAPALQIMLLISGTPFDPAQVFQSEIQNLQKQGVQQLGQFRRAVAGLESVALRFALSDPTTQLTVANEQCYVFLASDALAIVQIQADPDTFSRMEPVWSSILATAKLPKAPGIVGTAASSLPYVPDGSASASLPPQAQPGATGTAAASGAAPAVAASGASPTVGASGTQAPAAWRGLRPEGGWI